MVHDTSGSVFDEKFPRMLLAHAQTQHDRWREIHRTLADLAAFEQRVLLAGKHPTEGFYGEPSTRARTGEDL
eukprot:9193808-Alexandrium_andersonii.AAC.1